MLETQMICAAVMPKLLLPSLPYKLIQAIRLAQAIMESDYTVCVPKEHAFKFQILKELFGAEFEIMNKDEGFVFEDFEITHPEPITRIGSITRPLIFPHAILRHCKSLWPEQRPTYVSFAGLVTGKPSRIIGDWCQKNIPESKDGIPDLNPFFHRTINKLRKKIGLTPKSYSVQLGKLLLWSSLRGRAFPIKSWDQDYFDLMAQSEFVLCPSGVHVWSYRFFECILCGSIPVIEANCPAYDGFKFFTMDDPIESLQWDQETAEHNYQLCVERISIPPDELNAEIESIISKQA